MGPQLKPLFVVLLAVGCARAPEPVDVRVDARAPVNVYGQPAVQPAPASAYASDFKPAPPLHPGHDGDLPDLACRKAVSLGCPQSNSCAYDLRQKGDDALFTMRMQAMLVAQNKRHVRDGQLLPCDAGDDLQWDGDGEAPPAWRAQTGEAPLPKKTGTTPALRRCFPLPSADAQ